MKSEIRNSLECASLSWALLQFHRPYGLPYVGPAPSQGVPHPGTSTLQWTIRAAASTGWRWDVSLAARISYPIATAAVRALRSSRGYGTLRAPTPTYSNRSVSEVVEVVLVCEGNRGCLRSSASQGFCDAESERVEAPNLICLFDLRRNETPF
eukprot:COSAG02_NODE_1526_length_12092_cov_10.672392_2_plen_153_part_00